MEEKEEWVGGSLQAGGTEVRPGGGGSTGGRTWRREGGQLGGRESRGHTLGGWLTLTEK